AGPSRGRWNARWGAVQPLDLSALHARGTYRVRALGSLSPLFRIASRSTLFVPRVADTVTFFQAQRDGADVVRRVLRRRPSHLHHSALVVYAPPRYESPDSDTIVGASLRPVGGPVDLAGGWMDAGDFLEFTHTTAYAETLLLAARRELGPAAPASLAAETRVGLRRPPEAWGPP